MRIRVFAFAGAALACAVAVRAGDVSVRKEPMTEQSLIGVYHQPEWTTHRRFPTTRVYLQQQPWQVGVEQWVRSKYYEGERGKHRIQEEIEVGLPHRMQMDLYVNSEINTRGTWYYDNFAGELRYAFADWGRIPLNPTIYGEYKIKDDGPDVAEGKLLLGDVYGGGWNVGVNLAYEWDLGGEHTIEYAASAACSHAVIDRRLSLGVEVNYTSESVEGSRGDPENSLNAGPSLQWRPTDATHLDLVVMPGLTDEAPDLLTFFVFGYDFGRVKASSYNAPVSIRAD